MLTPSIVQTEALPMAKIRARVPSREIQSHMGALVAELLAEMQTQGVAPAGPMLTHHFRPPDVFFDFEVCFPVSKPVRPARRMEPGEWPAMRVLRAVHEGSYSGLAAAWGELMAWAVREGIATTEEVWERYLVGPATNPDAAKWRTELNRPLS